MTTEPAGQTCRRSVRYATVWPAFAVELGPRLEGEVVRWQCRRLERERGRAQLTGACALAAIGLLTAHGTGSGAGEMPGVPSVAAVLANLLLIGLLPNFFFKKGQRNARWIATAAPFNAVIGLAVLSLAGVTGPRLPSHVIAATSVGGVVVALTSAFVIGVAVGSHRVPISLWHQTDEPEEIVTWGAYRRVRHPLYSAFLTALAASLLVIPSAAMAVVVAAGVAAIAVTARLEERRLLASHLGAQYADYMRSTGRFLPKVRLTAVGAVEGAS